MLVSTIDIFFRGLGVGLASSITVGPVAVLCIQRTLSKNRRSGLASGSGVAVADMLMAIIAYFFYSMLQAQIEEYSAILQVVGGIFVVIVGVYIFFQNPVPQIRRNRAGKTNLWQDFSSMFVFTLANFVVVIPYLLAFFAMFNVGLQSEGGDIASLARSAVTILGSFWIIGQKINLPAGLLQFVNPPLCIRVRFHNIHKVIKKKLGFSVKARQILSHFCNHLFFFFDS